MASRCRGCDGQLEDRRPVTHSDLARRIHAASDLTGQFTLRSGRTATEYFDMYRFEGDPILLDEIAQRMAAWPGSSPTAPARPRARHRQSVGVALHASDSCLGFSPWTVGHHGRRRSSASPIHRDKSPSDTSPTRWPAPASAGTRGHRPCTRRPDPRPDHPPHPPLTSPRHALRRPGGGPLYATAADQRRPATRSLAQPGPAPAPVRGDRLGVAPRAAKGRAGHRGRHFGRTLSPVPRDRQTATICHC